MNRKLKVVIIILIIITDISIFLNFYYFEKYEIEKYRAINSENNENNAFVHFSIDDCINIFYDLDENKNKYNSIFDNSLLKYLKKLNSEYGCKFSLYVFENNETFNIKDCTEKYKDEFEENSSWLKFGFHGLNTNSDYNRQEDKMKLVNDYKLVINNLKRIVGEKSITNIFRIEKFLCNSENAKELKEEIKDYTLLGADTENRLDYYLTEEKNKKLFESECYFDQDTKILFYNTDFRLENIENNNINKMLDSMQDKNLIIFTHEWIFDNVRSQVSIKYKINEICKYAIKNGYKFEYPYNN